METDPEFASKGASFCTLIARAASPSTSLNPFDTERSRKRQAYENRKRRIEQGEEPPTISPAQRSAEWRRKKKAEDPDWANKDKERRSNAHLEKIKQLSEAYATEQTESQDEDAEGES
ncbi:hypothetical protein L202_03898 [Cryptococcus amylolentus CBS 6039]|uniref:Uncharacterized protein n=1 Tax=Cryptococcus amylolentus CBS 6039 TaxID=1295533 RepID=A0A1E3HW93_9TREE|nr:hypothetical protein L202_03898 [Cryptococcus amylolentus CBS 6039]ODN80036.1 hypothetical protein L202_03898 [Cryptococcus amylolentus CBS 6039]